jgi:hypothetical protein
MRLGNGTSSGASDAGSAATATIVDASGGSSGGADDGVYSKFQSRGLIRHHPELGRGVETNLMPNEYHYASMSSVDETDETDDAAIDERPPPKPARDVTARMGGGGCAGLTAIKSPGDSDASSGSNGQRRVTSSPSDHTYESPQLARDSIASGVSGQQSQRSGASSTVYERPLPATSPDYESISSNSDRGSVAATLDRGTHLAPPLPPRTQTVSDSAAAGPTASGRSPASRVDAGAAVDIDTAEGRHAMHISAPVADEGFRTRLSSVRPLTSFITLLTLNLTRSYLGLEQFFVAVFCLRTC